MSAGIKHYINEVETSGTGTFDLADVKQDFDKVNFIIFTREGTFDTSEYDKMDSASGITSAQLNILNATKPDLYYLAKMPIIDGQAKTDIKKDELKKNGRFVIIANETVEKIVIKGYKGHPFKGQPDRI